MVASLLPLDLLTATSLLTTNLLVSSPVMSLRPENRSAASQFLTRPTITLAQLVLTPAVLQDSRPSASQARISLKITRELLSRLGRRNIFPTSSGRIPSITWRQALMSAV